MVKKTVGFVFGGLKAVTIVFLPVIIFLTLIEQYAIYKNIGDSMSPALADDELMIVKKDYGELETGDIIVIYHEAFGEITKRVIGVEGDTVEFKNNDLYLNGERKSESYLDLPKDRYPETYRTEDFKMKEITGEKVIPKGKVFVLGDNRKNSADSREFGFIDLDEILGVKVFNIKG